MQQRRRGSGRSGDRPAKRVAWLDENGDPVELTPAVREKTLATAMNTCLWHLERSSKTEKELRDRLVKKRLPESVIEETLARLRELGYVNDERYAHSFVQTRAGSRRQGKQVIRRELARRGIEQDVAAEALEQVTAEDEAENAQHLAARKVRSTRGLERQKRVQRLAGMLARRGYGGAAFTVARDAVLADELAEASEADDGPVDDAVDGGGRVGLR